jgi:hypothetical protein
LHILSPEIVLFIFVGLMHHTIASRLSSRRQTFPPVTHPSPFYAIPFSAHSPSPRHSTLDHDLILPDWDPITSDCPDSLADDYIHPAVGECLVESGSLLMVLQDARLQEARAALSQAEAAWNQRLFARRESNKISVQALLARHAHELAEFAELQPAADPRGAPPPRLETVLHPDPTAVLHARRIGAPATPPFVATEILQARQRLIARHTAEIVALNEQCVRGITELRRMRDDDLGRKRRAVEALSGESADAAQQPAAPSKAARVARLSRKALPPLC